MKRPQPKIIKKEIILNTTKKEIVKLNNKQCLHRMKNKEKKI